jgi:hypothetical protein
MWLSTTPWPSEMTTWNFGRTQIKRLFQFSRIPTAIVFHHTQVHTEPVA